MENLFDLNRRLNALSVFRSLLDTQVIRSFQKLLSAIENGSLDEQLFNYGAFSRALYEEGADLSKFILRFIKEDENLFLINTAINAEISRSIRDCTMRELGVLQELSNTTTPQITKLIDYHYELPQWDNSKLDLKKEYENLIDNIGTSGYGIFTVSNGFRVKSGKLIPVKTVDEPKLTSLYGYERERMKILKNTESLALGKGASNVLLYGDAGTGKSTTIKACASQFYKSGLRLIEFTKDQLSEIPAIMESLSNSPLKFIFYIDDLSFNEGDASYNDLKGILEGNITAPADNIAIYATSNRRHLVKEASSTRSGDDLHLADTLQEVMSLSARFGLTVTFMKPEKDDYIEIVQKLAEEAGIAIDQNDLILGAERHAIRVNGRSPRTAKQYIKLLKTGVQ